MADDANNQDTSEDRIEEHEDLFDTDPVNDEGNPDEGEPDNPDEDKEDDGTEDDDKHEEVDPGQEDKKTDPDPEKETPEGEEDPKERARREYAERQARKNQGVDSYVESVRREEKRKQSELDPEDPNYRLDILESENNIRNAEAAAAKINDNLSQLSRDGDVVQQTVPMFRQFNQDGTPNPGFNQAAFEAAEREFTQRYAAFSDDEKPEDRVFLGAYDPRTGEPVSYLYFMKQKAEEYGTVAGVSAKKASDDARIAERKMRGSSDPVGGGNAPKKENSDDKEAREMAAAFGH